MKKETKIYTLAGNLLTAISHGLNEEIYARLSGQLSFAFSVDSAGASASSRTTPFEGPKHTITFGYKFLIKIYEDCEGLCKFVNEIPSNSWATQLYATLGGDLMPPDFNQQSRVRNMFLGTIAWVYFHELGHLIQEHGIVKRKFMSAESKSNSEDDIHEFSASNQKKLAGKDALISHVMELEADSEATYFAILDVVKHFNKPPKVKGEKIIPLADQELGFADSKRPQEDFASILYLLVCGVSMLFFRFTDHHPIQPTLPIEGSHPHPSIRLELFILKICDRLYNQAIARREDAHGGEQIVSHGMTKDQLVVLCRKAAFLAGLYWLSLRKNPTNPIDVLANNPLNSPVGVEYLDSIIKVSKELRKTISKSRHFGLDAGLMCFEPALAQQLGN